MACLCKGLVLHRSLLAGEGKLGRTDLWTGDGPLSSAAADSLDKAWFLASSRIHEARRVLLVLGKALTISEKPESRFENLWLLVESPDCRWLISLVVMAAPSKKGCRLTCDSTEARFGRIMRHAATLSTLSDGIPVAVAVG